MPKERRKRTAGHDQSVRLSKRPFVLQGNTEIVEMGDRKEAPAAEVLSEISAPVEKPIISKKEKQQLKHEAFLQRLESSHTPYSKSHVRRLKRKAKEEVAHGLQDIALALPILEDLNVEAPKLQDTYSMNTDGPAKPQQKHKTGQIGEGKGAPLSNHQRKMVLKTEKFRQPLLISTPEFSSNPFQAIRTHAQNTLVKHHEI